MNIVVLNGSPRPKGNTAAMVQAFTEGATEAGHQVTVVNIGNKKIGGCKHCDYCHTKEKGTCIQKDDMQEIYPVLKEAEMLVIASPIYYFSMTGQMHCTIERMYIWDVMPNIKKAALILSALESGFEAPIQTYKDAFIDYMNAEDMGIITAVGSEHKSEKKLEEARQLGRLVLNRV